MISKSPEGLVQERLPNYQEILERDSEATSIRMRKRISGLRRDYGSNFPEGWKDLREGERPSDRIDKRRGFRVRY